MNYKILSPQMLGNALRDVRKLKGLTQARAGKPVGVDQTTVSNVERGNPGTRLDTLFRLLAALDLELVLQPREHPPLDGEDW